MAGMPPEEDLRLLRRLLDSQTVAALATLHKGEPAVSMVPFVWNPGSGTLLIHVSALATHTRDMQAHARVGLLIAADAQAGVSPQARPRVSLQCEAMVLPREAAAYETAKAAYLARFADAAVTFELGDFSIVALRPVAARLVAGFARAHGLVGEPLARWLAS
jgi:putative heme iron utilization protein